MLQKLFCVVSTISNRFGDFPFPAGFVDCGFASYICVGTRYARKQYIVPFV
jgi:hypothetical protein